MQHVKNYVNQIIRIEWRMVIYLTAIAWTNRIIILLPFHETEKLKIDIN